MAKYTEEGAVKLLSAISGVSVDSKSKVIEVNKDAQIGNGTWGKIEYLVKYCEYTQFRNSGKTESKKSEGKKRSKNKKGESK